MIRAFTSSALALALTFGGAAMAQQASGTAGASAGVSGNISGNISDGVGAPASEATGVKGVYSTKRMMGITTGATADDGADASGADETSAAAEGDADQASD